MFNDDQGRSICGQNLNQLDAVLKGNHSVKTRYAVCSVIQIRTRAIEELEEYATWTWVDVDASEALKSDLQLSL